MRIENEWCSIEDMGQEHKEGLFSCILRQRHNKTSDDFNRSVFENAVYSFVGKLPDGRVAWYFSMFHVENTWVFECYRDDDMMREFKNAHEYSLHAGRLMIRYIVDTITDRFITAVQKENRAAGIIAKKLGFIRKKCFVYDGNEYVTFEYKEG